jgi:hypothetical protein
MAVLAGISTRKTMKRIVADGGGGRSLVGGSAGRIARVSCAARQSTIPDASNP